MSEELSVEQRARIETYLRKSYFSSVGAPTPGTEAQAMSEEYAIRLASKFVVSLMTAWWSLTEFFEYIKKRQTFKEFERLTSNANHQEPQ